MKEATGEANMTIVTVILIAAIVAIATPIVKNMMDNTKNQSKCLNEGKCWEGGKCVACKTTM